MNEEKIAAYLKLREDLTSVRLQMGRLDMQQEKVLEALSKQVKAMTEEEYLEALHRLDEC